MDQCRSKYRRRLGVKACPGCLQNEQKVNTPRRHLLPRRLTAYAHQPPLSQAVIQAAYSRPDGLKVLRSPGLAWASRAESLRAAR